MDRAAPGRLGDVPLLTDAEAIRERSLDTYWKAAALARDGRAHLPDAVAQPRNAEEVASTLAAAVAEGIPVVPRGGGSGSQGGAVADAGGIVLDLSARDEILELDESALTVRAQAGVPGLGLEEWLGERGYAFPHYRPRSTSPRSVAISPPRAPACCRRSTGRSRTWSPRWRSRCRPASWCGRSRSRATPRART